MLSVVNTLYSITQTRVDVKLVVGLLQDYLVLDTLLDFLPGGVANCAIGVNLGMFRAILGIVSLNCDFCDFFDFCDKISEGK